MNFNYPWMKANNEEKSAPEVEDGAAIRASKVDKENLGIYSEENLY